MVNIWTPFRGTFDHFRWNAAKTKLYLPLDSLERNKFKQICRKYSFLIGILDLLKFFMTNFYFFLCFEFSLPSFFTLFLFYLFLYFAVFYFTFKHFFYFLFFYFQYLSLLFFCLWSLYLIHFVFKIYFFFLFALILLSLLQLFLYFSPLNNNKIIFIFIVSLRTIFLIHVNRVLATFITFGHLDCLLFSFFNYFDYFDCLA